MSDRDRVRSAHGRVEEPRNTTDFDDFVGYDYQSESPSHRGRRDLRVEGMVTFCFVAFYRHVSISNSMFKTHATRTTCFPHKDEVGIRDLDSMTTKTSID